MIYLILAFIVAIAFEVFYAKKHALSVYEFPATVAHFTLGAGQTALNILTGFTLIAVYNAVYQSFHLFEMREDSLLLSLSLILVADFCYYFAHRISHRVNFFVAAHVVHHQAEDFNHGSALRQSWTSRPVMFLFYLPLALVGVPLKPLLGALLVNLFIQFFSHNGVIRRKLGFLEYIFVTPRSHRIHHGTNEPYIDRNYSGIFIFWDFLFGTFRELDESVPVQIGPKNGTNLFNPINSNMNYYQRILFVARRRTGIVQKLSIWFQSPEQLEAELALFGYQDSEPRPTLPVYTREAKIAILGMLTFTIGALVVLITNKDAFGTPAKVISTFAVIGGAWMTGRLLTRPVFSFARGRSS